MPTEVLSLANTSRADIGINGHSDVEDSKSLDSGESLDLHDSEEDEPAERTELIRQTINKDVLTTTPTVISTNTKGTDETEDDILDKYESSTTVQTNLSDTPPLDSVLEEDLLIDDVLKLDEKLPADVDDLDKPSDNNDPEPLSPSDSGDSKLSQPSLLDNDLKLMESSDGSELKMNDDNSGSDNDLKSMKSLESDVKSNEQSASDLERQLSNNSDKSSNEAVNESDNDKSEEAVDEMDAADNNKKLIEEQQLEEAAVDDSSISKECTEAAAAAAEDDETLPEMDVDENKIEDAAATNNTDKIASLEEANQQNNEDNSNDSSEDLMDVSVIRDADEDAASAYNEERKALKDAANEDSEDKQSEDKTDEDDDEDNSAGDGQTIGEASVATNSMDTEEEENSVEATATITDGDVDGSTSDNNLSDKTVHNNCTENNDLVTSENVVDKQSDEIVEQKDNNTTELSDKVIKDKDKDVIVNEKRKDRKRTLSMDSDSSTGSSKKTKTTDEDRMATPRMPIDPPNEEPQLPTIIKLQSLCSLADFMKDKHLKVLSRSALEEFCLQKICESIVHKSELGEVHRQLKVQEQMIETMRKDVQQLTKQARDLEIVNKKLMNDLKQHNTTNKPLSPLKITRSVGLQVKLCGPDNSLKRRSSSLQSPITKIGGASITNKFTNNNRNNNNNNTPNGNAATTTTNNIVLGGNRQISPQKQNSLTAGKLPNTPLLSQALQSRRQTVAGTGVTNNNAATTPLGLKTTSKSAVDGSGKTTTSSSSSFIDLTDDDDRKVDKNMKSTPPRRNPLIAPRPQSRGLINTVKTAPTSVRAVPLKIATPQGGKAAVTTTTAQQVMYVVQSNTTQSMIGAQKTVLLNLQPANNGVINATALSNPAVSVIPKSANHHNTTSSSINNNLNKTLPITSNTNNNNSISLKQSGTMMKSNNKHPAPLPTPPVVRVTGDKMPLKAVPPKPHLTIKKTDTGIILQWKMPYELEMYELIASYQLYAYQETTAAPSTDMWRRVGDVKALALPMACTLTQFADKNKYYFAVRPVDVHKRIGAFSEPEEISL